ncbi:lipid A deacylase LpxR family protein [Kangiella sp. HZ709]|uniref:lipid A deacylase LpxR family protein n=1 Tax=Kangiella sp. HZ709 TaxID=2666328 RepID=UPI0012B0BF62|nr:lipid A deacylase LpxR family protein [Kangiella sp. HZ709]MRX26870.1 DUF2219 family protein [Kangiella sp. HZ709]
MRKIYTLLLLVALQSMALAEDFEWTSVTFDNDLFTGSDNGYTNGLTISLYDISEEEALEASWMTSPFLGIMSDKASLATLDIYTVGQIMQTPGDITLPVPPQGDVPYAGLLYVANNYIKVYENYSEDFTTTVGIVGPASGAKRTQRLVHSLFGADEPMGWSFQLKNEPVFKLNYGRTYRAWKYQDETSDVLFRYEAGLGNLESSIQTSLLYRYGHNLQTSYPTAGFNSSRLSNPTATNGDWYFYFGLMGRYTFNTIFLDGNTFEDDSPSVDYERFNLGFIGGIAYSWQNISLTFSFTDQDILNEEVDGDFEQYNRYGSITVAWKL